MERKNSFPFWVIFGVGVVALAALGFVFASLAGAPRSVEPALLLPQETVTTMVRPTSRPSPTQISPVSPVQGATSVPTVAAVVPEIAPDFTLDQATGGTITLAEQLAQGTVVLVLMQSGGG